MFIEVYKQLIEQPQKRVYSISTKEVLIMRIFKMADDETTYDGKVSCCLISDEYGNIGVYNSFGNIGVYNNSDVGFRELPKDNFVYIGGLK